VSGKKEEATLFLGITLTNLNIYFVIFVMNHPDTPAY